MTVKEFWEKVDRITRRCEEIHVAVLPSEQRANVMDFLLDMDALASEWVNDKSDDEEVHKS